MPPCSARRRTESRLLGIRQPKVRPSRAERSDGIVGARSCICRPGAFGDLADDATASPAGDPLVDLAHAEVGGGCKRLDLADDARRCGRPAQVPATRFGGPVKVGPLASDRYVGLINAPACRAQRPLLPAQPFLNLGRVSLNPTIDRRMAEQDAALAHHLLDDRDSSPHGGNTIGPPRARSHPQSNAP